MGSSRDSSSASSAGAEDEALGATAGSDLVGAALTLAARAHSGQRRANGEPYLAHPLRVCELLTLAGADAHTLAAALLHDSVEDSELTVAEVTERFGVRVGELVAALTDDERIDDWRRRKDALRARVAEAEPAAAAIYAADKLANLQELAELYEQHGERAAHSLKAPSLDLRVEAWRRDLELVQARLPDHRLSVALRVELDRFEARRGGRRATEQEAGARG